MTQTTPTTPDTLQKFLFEAAPVRGELVRRFGITHLARTIRKRASDRLGKRQP